ncbi:uncharacterized protein A1O9_08904 [Exophiala aquamarina CBS 119918]|uniref:SET domain-containing protein n=1 Tax=Exophiala aquamarina CBS 119918 TaxID=1182545 RepID=A0A072PIB2_9EURO|nr:uncharacterized protein A1O9_08904 [Exophiala aquamarina CBS 119918]KEF55250.1 hypothetical protein A1O9_08904 [Exophiala aquamarina CBS 119918]
MERTPFTDDAAAASNGSENGRAVILPPYLQHALSAALPGLSGPELVDFAHTPQEYLEPSQIRTLHDRNPKLQYAYLLLARHVYTETLKEFGARHARSGDAEPVEVRFEEAGDGVGKDEDEHEHEHEDDDENAKFEGTSPELVLERAEIYEALGYADLALADAYAAYTLLLVALGGHFDSDLVPAGRYGEMWVPSGKDGDDNEAEEEGENHDEGRQQEQQRRRRRRESGVDLGQWGKRIKASVCRALMILCRSALLLGCESQAKTWFNELVRRSSELPYDKGVWAKEFDEEVEPEQLVQRIVQKKLVNELWCIFPVDTEGLRDRVEKLGLSDSDNSTSTNLPLFGWSMREVYPWSELEPERMSKEALEDINAHLAKAAPDLEVKISHLPALGAAGGATDAADQENWAQLGLYAKEDLAPGSTILEERSMLTGIRPHGEALCDACAADMEAVPASNRRYCEGCNILFCSEECYSAATKSYHAPNAQNDETGEGYPPPESPFCPGEVGFDDIHTLGRAESSTTPEYDLYFLLLSRTLQVAETRQIHPLDLFEIKYLWGDFSQTRNVGDLASGRQAKTTRTLPFSVRHHVELPLQWFEILMHSRRECRPYSAAWLQKYDWWIVQTLFAKFRGVADAQQSTWTGMPEVAAVHPLWCLANHSCNPNVTWKPSGVRNLTVVKGQVWSAERGYAEDVAEGAWDGIKKGEEIWNHYTDIHEKDCKERRGRLQAVLGGECRCERCIAEAGQDSLVDRETR